MSKIIQYCGSISSELSDLAITSTVSLNLHDTTVGLRPLIVPQYDKEASKYTMQNKLVHVATTSTYRLVASPGVVYNISSGRNCIHYWFRHNTFHSPNAQTFQFVEQFWKPSWLMLFWAKCTDSTSMFHHPFLYSVCFIFIPMIRVK